MRESDMCTCMHIWGREKEVESVRERVKEI
jgi:hypothetical protein